MEKKAIHQYDGLPPAEQSDFQRIRETKNSGTGESSCMGGPQAGPLKDPVAVDRTAPESPG
jgi:hypothetical protein